MLTTASTATARARVARTPRLRAALLLAAYVVFALPVGAFCLWYLAQVSAVAFWLILPVMVSAVLVQLASLAPGPVDEEVKP